MIDKFIPALICITVFVLLGVAVCRVGARADRRMAAENRELQPIGYESAQVDALEEFKARKAQFIADAMKAERERLLSVRVIREPGLLESLSELNDLRGAQAKRTYDRMSATPTAAELLKGKT